MKLEIEIQARKSGERWKLENNTNNISSTSTEDDSHFATDGKTFSPSENI